MGQCGAMVLDSTGPTGFGCNLPSGHEGRHARVEQQEPRPTVVLSDLDGNAFGIMGAVKQALREAGASKEHIAAFLAEASSGDYQHLLQTAMKFAEVE